MISIEFSSVFDTSPDAIFIVSPQGWILDANRTALQRYGYRIDELQTMQVADLVQGDRQQGPPALDGADLASAVIVESNHRCKDGHALPVEILVQPVRVADQPAAILQVRDLTGRASQPGSVQRSNQHILERILDTEPGTVYIFDLTTQQNIYVNRQWLADFGYTAEDVIALDKGLMALFHPDDRPLIASHHAAWRTATGAELRSIEYRLQDRAGNWHWLMSRETPFARDANGQVEQILGIAYDITANKQAERERELFVSLAKNSKEFIGIADLNFRPFYVNDAALRLVGLPDLDTVRRLKVQDFFFPEDQAMITNDFFPRVMREGNAEIEVRFRHFETGKAIWMLYNVFCVHDDRGTVAGWATVSRNITDRKYTEEVLQLSEQRFRNYMDNAPTIAWMKDEQGRYVYLSGGYEKRFAVALENCLGKTDFELWPAAIAEAYRENDLRVLGEKSVVEVVEQTLDANGRCAWWRNFRFPFQDAAGNSYVGGIGLDITEQKASDIKIRRLTQLYAALSHCNQAIVRCTDQTELFPQVCRDTVTFGGMQMAWIGLLDADRQWVRPVASFGAGVAYLDGMEISTSLDHACGRGPTGTAVRENRPVWCEDFQHDPTTGFWHERAARFGWGASASLPLHRRNVVVGTLNLYFESTHAFDGSVQNLLVKIAMDISAALDRFASEEQHKKDEEDLRVSEQHLRTIIETEPECVSLVHKSGRISEINAAGLAVLEVDSLEQARAHNFLDFILPCHHAGFRALHEQAMRGENATLEFEMVGCRGTRRWLEIHAAPMRDAKGGISAVLGVTRDVTERKLSEERIRYLANFDALTGLPNRTQLGDHLKYALSLARRGHGTLAMMFIDLDRFKDINDTLGHSVGDAVLVEVAQRLRRVLRDEDTASRLGGDEFVVILANGELRGVTLVAEKLLRILSEPYRIAPYDLNLTASIGIALYPDDGSDLESLSKSADTAMYRAKSEGRDCYRFFTAEMQAGVIRNMKLVNALRHALDQTQFEVCYQPQMAISNDCMIGVEALLRWHHPELGPVSPDEFIPAAEECGLILPIGEWVLRTAVRQLRCWMTHGLAPMTVAVNLSAVQFRHPALPEIVTRILTEERLPAELLELELTEGVAMHDPPGAIAIMNGLHELGIRMAVDDFGTGYSSLSYLKKFKVSRLKIDQSFVQDISTDMEDKAIVAAVISMAKSLGIRTIAEGVETAEQLAFLREQGCDEAQGHFFSEALPASAIATFVAGTSAGLSGRRKAGTGGQCAYQNPDG